MSTAHAAITHASTIVVAAGNPFSGWIGSPNISWLAPLKSDIAKLSGYGLGGVILACLLMVGFGAFIVGTAGKNEARSRHGAATIVNAGKGVGIVIIGIPAAVLIIGALIVIFG